MRRSTRGFPPRGVRSLARNCLLGTGLMVVSLGGGAFAQTARIGPEFQVNTYTTGYQENSAVACHPTGSFVVVWESDSFGASMREVAGQIFNSSGVKQGTEFSINSYTTGQQRYPAVSVAGSFDFVVAWESNLQDGSLNGIYGQRFNGSGAKVGSEFRVNTYTTDQQETASIDYDGTGKFVAVWTSAGQDGAYGGIFGQRYASSGATTGSEIPVNFTTSDNQDYPNVGADSSGRFVVVWESYGQDRSDYGVFGRMYTATGSASGHGFQVNSYTLRAQGSPAIAVNGPGNFVVTWESYAQDTFGMGVYAQRYTSTGSTVGGEFRANTYTYDDQDSPRVAMDDTGRFVIVWQSRAHDGSATGIFGQRYDSAGAPLGAEFQVNTYTTSAQRSPSVCADSAGNFVTVWTSVGQDGSVTGVFGQRFAFANCPLPSASGPSSQAVCAGGTTFLTLTPSGVSPFTYQWRKGGVNLADGGAIRGTRSQTLRISPVSAADVGNYDTRITDYCLPPVTATSGTAALTLKSGQVAGAVTGLTVQKINAGSSLKLTWNNATNAADYVVYTDTSPRGVFETIDGTSSSGTTGWTTPTPTGNRYYLVAGRNAGCGAGPVQ